MSDAAEPHSREVSSPPGHRDVGRILRRGDLQYTRDLRGGLEGDDFVAVGHQLGHARMTVELIQEVDTGALDLVAHVEGVGAVATCSGYDVLNLLEQLVGFVVRVG